MMTGVGRRVQKRAEHPLRARFKWAMQALRSAIPSLTRPTWMPEISKRPDPPLVQLERIRLAQLKAARRARRDWCHATRMLDGNARSVWLRTEDGRVLRGDEVQAEARALATAILAKEVQR